ncbi:hypothetical protein ACLKA7_009975 [Drosophila subpalustris]
MFEGIFLARSEDEQHPPPPLPPSEIAPPPPPSPEAGAAQDGACWQKKHAGRRRTSSAAGRADNGQVVAKAERKKRIAFGFGFLTQDTGNVDEDGASAAKREWKEKMLCCCAEG